MPCVLVWVLEVAIGVVYYMMDASHVWEYGCERYGVTRVRGHMCRRVVVSCSSHVLETRGDCDHWIDGIARV